MDPPPPFNFTSMLNDPNSPSSNPQPSFQYSPNFYNAQQYSQTPHLSQITQTFNPYHHVPNYNIHPQPYYYPRPNYNVDEGGSFPQTPSDKASESETQVNEAYHCGDVQEIEKGRGKSKGKGKAKDVAKESKRISWTKEEDIRLVGAWLNNSVDSIKGNNKKGDFYWGKVEEDFNKTCPDEMQQTAKQLKDHWQKSNKKVTHFHNIWSKLMDNRKSGESDDIIMQNALSMYQDESENGRPFTLMHWWELVRGFPKWNNAFQKPQGSKRTKVTESGSYTSSREQEEEEVEVRPQGQKAAKAAQKAQARCKGKNVSSSNELEYLKEIDAQRVEQENKFMEMRLELGRKKAQRKLISQYDKCMMKDTSTMSGEQLEMHKKLILYLEKELGMN